MSLKLYRPGPDGLEPNPAAQRSWRGRLVSRRWNPAALDNPEQLGRPARRMAVVFWVFLAALTFVLIVVGYGTGFWA